MSKQQPKPQPFGFEWRPHLRTSYRVWRTDWAGDQFEIVTIAEFYVLEAMCKRFSILLKEAGDD